MILYQRWLIVTISLTIMVWCSSVDSLHFADGKQITRSHQQDEEDPSRHVGQTGYKKLKPPSHKSAHLMGILGEDALTHTGWLQLGQRSYKIYRELVTYAGAKQRCVRHHPDAQLAVVTSFSHSQTLGRYLRSGTSKLLYAWIGAKWYSGGYQFEPEPIRLQNTSDSTWYPPWKYKKILKSGKCILLDRHVANITVFLEADCERLRPYICYIENNTDFTDLISGEYAYRLHRSKRNWTDARNYCKDVYVHSSVHLAEIRETTQFYDLLNLMMQKGPLVRRAWIGGIFNKSASSPTWLWDSKKDRIPTGSNTRMKWVSDIIYESPTKSDDNCIAMDDSEMNYGMPCKLEQSYICQFSAKSLKRLQDHKKKKTKPADFKRYSTVGKQQDTCESQLCTNKRNPDGTGRRKRKKSSTWIQVGQNLYKIFNISSSYYNAKQKCLSYHPDASLAVVPSISYARILGGHLTKAAWIGAKWVDGTYQFEPQPIKLRSTPDTAGYPPWSYSKMQLKGCVALDHHALFVESHCQQKLPYICYMENGAGFTDLIIGNHGYRLYHNKKKWTDARDICKNVYATHSAHLVEIKQPIEVNYLGALMEKHGKATRHVWLGAKFYKMGTPSLWFWEDSCGMISMGPDSLLNWDNSTTYLSSIDEDCIIMDVSGISYGVACEYELNYVCQFSADRLRLQQREETNPKK